MERYSKSKKIGNIDNESDNQFNEDNINSSRVYLEKRQNNLSKILILLAFIVLIGSFAVFVVYSINK